MIETHVLVQHWDIYDNTSLGVIAIKHLDAELTEDDDIIVRGTKDECNHVRDCIERCSVYIPGEPKKWLTEYRKQNSMEIHSSWFLTERGFRLVIFLKKHHMTRSGKNCIGIVLA